MAEVNDDQLFGDMDFSMLDIVGPIPNGALPMKERENEITESRIRIVSEFAKKCGAGSWARNRKIDKSQFE